MLRTGGYDLLVEINERMINRALAAAFYTSYFSNFKGSIVPRIPGPLGKIAEVRYDILLTDPLILDMVPKDKAKLWVNGIANLELAGGIRVSASLSASLLVTIKMDPSTNKMMVALQEIKIAELKFLRRYRLTDPMNMLLNAALKEVIGSHLLQALVDRNIISILEIPVSSLIRMDKLKINEKAKVSVLPGLPGIALVDATIDVPVSELIPEGTIDLGKEVDVAVTPSYFGVINMTTMAAAVSFQEGFIGDPEGVKDFTNGNDLAIGLSEASLHRILDDLWPQLPEWMTGNAKIDVENVKELMDSLKGLYDMPANLNTLGLPQKRTQVDKAWVDLMVKIRPDKPNIRLVEGGKLELLDLKVRVHAQATVKAALTATITTGQNPFLSMFQTKKKEVKEPEVKSAETVLYTFETDADVTIQNAAAVLKVDGNGQLLLEVSDIEFEMKLPWRLPKMVLDTISKRMKGIVKEVIPSINATKLLEEKLLADLPMQLELRAKEVLTGGSEAIIIANVDFKGIPGRITPVPRFIGNIDQSSRVVHRADCPGLAMVPEKDKVGYPSLYDALADGLKAADDCISNVALAGKKDTSVIIPELDLHMPSRSSPTKASSGPRRSIPIHDGGPQPCPPTEPAPQGNTSAGQSEERVEKEVEREEDHDGPAHDKQEMVVRAGQRPL
jgi:hypothetical protein